MTKLPKNLSMRHIARYAVLLFAVSSTALTMLPFSTAHAQSVQSAQQAAQAALKRSGGSGKVLGVSTEKDNNGKRVFAVKILSNGRVSVERIPEN